MIHDIKLSPLIKRRLSDVVDVQIALLEYAASTNSPSRTGCAEFLEKRDFDKVKQGRSLKIAQWIWRSKKRRRAFLTNFAAEESTKKKELVEKLKREIMLLAMEVPTGTIDIFSESHPEDDPEAESNLDTEDSPDAEDDADTENDLEAGDHAEVGDDRGKTGKKPKKSWLMYGADFLRLFYDDLSEGTLPEYLFTETNAGDFTRQDFLRAFLAENKTLYVCPVCDESGSYTISSKNKIYTEIEHYFPKSLYPHLSCHPYNLMPICHLCNAPIHRDKDPLQPDGKDPRLQLEQIALPYRGLALGMVTRLDIDLDDTSAIFKSLVSIEIENTYETHIRSLSWVYDIPGRWNTRFGVDKVGETLFRRMKQFLRGTHELSIGNSPESVWPVLQYALYQLVHSLHTRGEESYKGGDFGKDPFAFAMKWLMVTILHEEKLHSGLDNEKEQTGEQPEFYFPLFKELNQWLGYDINDNDEYISCTEKLLKMLSNEAAALGQSLTQLEKGTEEPTTLLMKEGDL